MLLLEKPTTIKPPKQTPKTRENVKVASQKWKLPPARDCKIQVSAVLGSNVMGAQYRRVHRTFAPHTQTNATKDFAEKQHDYCRTFMYRSFLDSSL